MDLQPLRARRVSRQPAPLLFEIGWICRRVYLNPHTGRFNRLDPWSGNNFDPKSLHKYAYAHADPVNGIDPSGLGSIAVGSGGLVGLLAAIAIITVLAALLSAAIATAVTKAPSRDRNRGFVLYHYSALFALEGAHIRIGTYLTDDPGLTAVEAKYGLGITGRLPTTVFGIRVYPSEVSGPTPIQPSPNAFFNVEGKLEWVTTVSLPFSRIVTTRPVTP